MAHGPTCSCKMCAGQYDPTPVHPQPDNRPKPPKRGAL